MQRAPHVWDAPRRAQGEDRDTRVGSGDRCQAFVFQQHQQLQRPAIGSALSPLTFANEIG